MAIVPFLIIENYIENLVRILSTSTDTIGYLRLPTAKRFRKQESLSTFMVYPELLWKSIYTSNAIEGFNSKLKRMTRKRIPMNSEENATITITSCCADYNRNAGRIRLRHFSDLTDEQRQRRTEGNGRGGSFFLVVTKKVR